MTVNQQKQIMQGKTTKQTTTTKGNRPQHHSHHASKDLLTNSDAKEESTTEGVLQCFFFCFICGASDLVRMNGPSGTK